MSKREDDPANHRTESRHSTIYDIAERVGASPSTVSAVLNGTWKKRRISSRLADKVHKVAADMKFSYNMQARALRTVRTGMIGMIIPMHDNRYFSSISQQFESASRARGLFPIVVSTLRDPALEIETTRVLISYRIETLVATGCTDPESVADLCHQKKVKCINLDLPGTGAPSVISDNLLGCLELTQAVIRRVQLQDHRSRRDRIVFIGGREDHNTLQRIAGFRQAMKDAGYQVDDDQVHACGYEADHAEAAIKRIYEGLGGLPVGLVVNSTIAFEGILRFFKTLPEAEVRAIAVGCYDWDPFATMLNFPLVMVRQDVPAMVSKVFELIDAQSFDSRDCFLFPPHLVYP